MKVEILALCEAATYRHGGSLCLLNNFENYVADSYPAQISAAVVAKVRFFANDEGEHAMALQLVDVDGGIVWSKDARRFVVDLKSQWESFGHTELFHLVAQVRQCEHSVRLILDSAEVASVPLYCLLRTPS